MPVTIYCIHTITGLVETFNKLIKEEISDDVRVHHISDESLIRRVLANGGMTAEVRRRLFENVVAAAQAGADVVQVTCSSVTPAIACAATLVDIPVFSIDEPMARRAVEGYSRIGVMATNPGTLDPSARLLRRIAEQLQREVTVEPQLCEGAYEALLDGDRERHDEIVLGYFRELMQEVEVVVLAQASMARIIDTLDEADRRVPVLSSPRLAIRALAEYLHPSSVETE